MFNEMVRKHLKSIHMMQWLKKNQHWIDSVLMQLNVLEMAPRDLAPHVGAWTRGVAGDNPAYCYFVTNPFQGTPGVIGNLSVWALARARWAYRELSAMGYPARITD